MKVCYRCKKSKPFSAFHKKSAAKDGLQASCKKCNNNSAREWQQANPEKFEEIWKRNSYGDTAILKRKARRYGLTLEELVFLFEKTNGKCEICGKAPRKTLCVDHCHKTGKVRGLLCEICNKSLGGFYDSVETLESAIKYLKR